MANLKGKDYIETQDLSDDELGAAARIRRPS